MRARIVIGLFGALFAFSAGRAAAAPNIVVVDICSIRADHMTPYASSRDTTPRVEKLAKSGVVFENAMAVGSWCLPNYATLFTGRYPESHGLYTNAVRGVPEFDETLAEKLKEGGYETAAFSGGVYLLPDWGMDRGFDHYVNAFSTAPGQRHPAPLAANLDDVGQWLVDRGSSTKPFFLYVAVDNLHSPFELKAPPADDPGYEGIAEDTRTMGVPFARAYSGEPDGYPPEYKDLAARFKSDPKNIRHYNARYDQALRETDDEIGRFLDRLKKLGVDRKTIFVLTGDHGETLGEHGLLGHTQGLYETNVHVPLIVRLPGREDLAGKRYSQLVERVDLMPTLLDWAGVDASSMRLPGRSLEPLLREPSTPWRRYAFAGSHRNLPSTESDSLIDERVVRDERWKLHQSLYKDFYELYDLSGDPGETHDLARERPDVVARLAFELQRWVELNRPHAPQPPERSAPPSLVPQPPQL
ncbi:MAG: sulfatase [Elusimicrobiota bacterium]